MTDLATIARDNALHCEVRKIAYRQSKEGVVVSFVIHPNDVPNALATAPLGTRYQLVVVEIGDDELPKEVMPNVRSKQEPETPPASAPEQPARARKSVAPEKRLAMQCGIACADVVFRKFLVERDIITEPSEDLAALAVRQYCEVGSRAQIIPDTAAGKRWEQLAGEFEIWRRT